MGGMCGLKIIGKEALALFQSRRVFRDVFEGRCTKIPLPKDTELKDAASLLRRKIPLNHVRSKMRKVGHFGR